MKVTLIELVKRLSPVKEYVVPEREQTEPVSEPVQVVVGVKSFGIVRVTLRRVGSGAFIVKGEVIVRVRLELDSSTKLFEGVYVVERIAGEIAALAVPSST